MKTLIPKTVVMLSMVSLFTDIASESLYPVMPVFLKSIGFSVVAIGMLEGLAEAMAGLSKGYFGKRSDVYGKRLPFVRIGYAMSAFSKPMMALWSTPLWIFFARLTDRFGKGIRTAPRDALLSAEATPETKGKIFGFHRSMDTLGAVIGPLFALAFLHFYPGHYKTLFLVAFVPGIASIVLTFLVKEKQKPESSPPVKVGLFTFLTYWNDSAKAYRKLLTGLLIFALANSSDLFLILRAKDGGLSDEGVIGIYIFYNLIYAVFAFPLGRMADRIGLMNMLILGIFLFAITYGGMAFEGSMLWYGFLFLVYGLYAACTESIAKAIISNLVEEKDTATAMGTYHALQSVTLLMASSVAGVIWYNFGASTLFISAAILACIVGLYFWANRRDFHRADAVVQ